MAILLNRIRKSLRYSCCVLRVFKTRDSTLKPSRLSRRVSRSQCFSRHTYIVSAACKSNLSCFWGDPPSAASTLCFMILSSRDTDEFFRWQYSTHFDTTAVRKYLNGKKVRIPKSTTGADIVMWAIDLRQQLGEGMCHVTALADGQRS